ncbi:transglycosylase SLT domain-containing protein [Streptomyces californicus]|uniref:Transglycosylase SLT domain-containing protein n=1 Tax=Streptomyces californicus TaxID=67351 RepID=A0ABX7IUB3_9ACTN|nr:MULTISPECIES: transglycosylase SLT domain-containing protein [Streptomyces]QRV25965.1 transglycosylase SLT domain-containing protein [Streptomyces californicus]QRV39366.1 transglycosylase SLT domain-containing protein [Streptomyces californicus]
MPRISTLRITRSHQIAAAVLVAAGSVTAIAATGGTSEAQTSAARSSVSVEPVAAAGIPTAKDAAEKAAEQKAAESAAAKKAAEARSDKQAANRSTERKAVTPKKFSNNLDGWIRESLDIMKKKNIPGSYEGLHRNIMRESSGNPNAVNDWDINARNGIPSKGLLQVIQPTFDAYHVKGTPKKLTDPVANITAAANYAADRYGSIDNVDSAY